MAIATIGSRQKKTPIQNRDMWYDCKRDNNIQNENN